MASKSSKTIWLMCLPLVVLATAAIVVAWKSERDHADLNGAMTRASTLGLATDISVFQTNLPQSQNAALYPGANFSSRIDFKAPINSPLPWSTAELAKVKSDIDANIAQMALVEQASKLPGWAPKRNYTHPTFTLLPELATLKSYIRLFTARALVEWQAGNHQKASDDLVTAARLANFLRHEFGLIGTLVQIAGKAIVRAAVARLVEFSNASPDAVHLQQTVESTFQDPDIHHALSTELVLQLDGALILERSPESFAQAVSGNYALEMPRHLPTNTVALRTMIIKNVCDLEDAFRSHPDNPALAYKAALAVKPPQANDFSGEQVMFNVLQPYYPNAFRASFADPVRGQVLTVATQILAFKRDHGHLPTSLDALPKSVDTTDPFSHQPLLYTPTKDKFVLWSVGPDAVDDTQGVVPPKDNPNDIMFQTVDNSRPPILGH